MRIAAAFIFCTWFVSSAIAQPAEVSRVLRKFDFEERRLGNVEDLPMHWNKVEGPGLPHYVNGRLSNDRAHSGDYSFRFDLNGGSLIYRYDAGLIPVQPGAHYRVEGFVQTTPLPNARARISAYFLDRDGRPMSATVLHSDVYASPSNDNTWHKLGLEISASADGPVDPLDTTPVAASLIIELALLQPSVYAPSSLGENALFSQDIRGSAWFDDVTVSQVPRVTMVTSRPGNIFRRSDPLVLKVLVNDRFTDDLAAQLVIVDAQGNTVYQRSGALDMSAAQTLGPGRRRMTLALPDLEPGWYEAALVMTSRGEFVGKQTLDLIRLGDDGVDAAPDLRFGIVATDLPYQGWDDLPEILALLAAGRVKVAVWNESGDIQQMNSAGFDRLLERLRDLRIDPTACLIGVPSAIVEKMQRSATTRPTGPGERFGFTDIQREAWTRLIKADPQLWQPQISYLLARHAAHLHHWQIGADGSDAFATSPAMADVYKLFYKQFSSLVESPDLAIPWPAWYESEHNIARTVSLHIKPDVLPAQVPLYVSDIQAAQGSLSASTPLNGQTSIYLEPLAREAYGRDVQIRDFVQRIVYALSADARRIDVKLPFAAAESPTRESVDGDSTAMIKQPQELMLILRTVMTTLGNATFRGKVPVGEGVEAFLFDRAGQGILVLWDRGTGGGMKQLAINLGEHPRRVDLWGNSTPLLQQRARPDESSNVRIDVGPMPIFLVDIDGPLAQLRASVALDNPLIESSFKPHKRTIRFTNPYRQAISGSFRLTPPSGWVINPPTQTFSLNPGETFQREISIEFPYNSFAGAKTINAEFKVQADTNSTFIAPLTLKLGLSDVGLQTLALRDGDDVIVQQMITNYGEKPINYTAFAIYPGQARQERLVTNLAPGRTTIKKYRFTKINLTPAAKVRNGLKQLEGNRILNDEAAIQ
jgi:hypothetical protein